MFKNPRVFVEKEHGMEACGEGGIYVAFGAIPDHPGGIRGDLVAGEDGSVGSWVFFRNDLDGGEIRGKTGAPDLIRLLCVIALGHEDEAMAGCQIAECFLDHRQEFDLLRSDGVCESDDAPMFLVIHWSRAETFETCDE
jgi:hypothetical protein